MKQSKANRIIVFLFTLANVQTTGAISAQSHTLSKVYQTGEIQLVPEVRITDESMEGKAFFSGGATDLSLDNGGNIYICSPRAGVLFEFSPEGSFKRTIGRAGQGPGEFGLPVEAVWSRGLLYIRDLATQRTSLMSDDGKFLKSIDWTGIQWRKIRALPDGRIIAQRERLDFIDPNSGLNLTLDLFSPSLEYIRTIYRRTLRRNRYIEKPRFVNIPIPFSPEVFWEITPGGKLIIGYSGDSAIDIYDPAIGPACSFSLPFLRSRVTREDKEDWFLYLGHFSQSDRTSFQKPIPSYIAKKIEFPDVKPYFRALEVDEENNIWILPYPQRAAVSHTVIYIFRQNGQLISPVRLTLPSKFVSTFAPVAGGFWTTDISDEGIISIVKYRITARGGS